MKNTIGLAIFCVVLFVLLLVQSFIPPIRFLEGARLLLVPALFCYAALTLPYPAMLAAALVTGFLCDVAYVHVVGGQVEIAVGWSIIYFVILGSIASGFRPEMSRGRWWPVIPLSIVGTSCFLLLQFVMISVRREGFFFSPETAWRILVPGLLAGPFAMLVHFVVSFFNQLFWPRATQRHSAAARSY